MFITIKSIYTNFFLISFCKYSWKKFISFIANWKLNLVSEIKLEASIRNSLLSKYLCKR